MFGFQFAFATVQIGQTAKLVDGYLVLLAIASARFTYAATANARPGWQTDFRLPRFNIFFHRGQPAVNRHHDDHQRGNNQNRHNYTHCLNQAQMSHNW